MTTHDNSEKSGASRGRRLLLGGLALVVLGGLVLVWWRPGDAEREADRPVFTVQRGELVIDVVESGALENKDQVVIKNQVGKSTTIVFLLPEGSVVKEGDLIVELDSTDVEETLQIKSIELKNGEAALVQATETLAITRNQAEADVDKAELDVRFSKLDLKKYVEGLYPQSVEKAEADIMIAAEDLQRAEDGFTWTSQLHAKGFVTRTELQADELSATRKRSVLNLAKKDFELLKNYTHPQELEKLQADVKSLEMALERAHRKARADVVKAEATLMAQEAALATRQRRLTKAEEDVANCRLTAPADGMVVYATSSGHRRRQEQIEVGGNVQYRQALIHIPRSDEMMASFSVPEAMRPKLHEGMAAVVRMPALPGQHFKGKLTKLGILPDSSQAWLNPDLKVYRCEVVLDEPNGTMRPGMNCQVEIVVEEYPDAVFVPIQCVLQVDEKPTVFVRHDDTIAARTIETGLDNNIMIHVLSGLEAGEEVLLAPPLEAASKGHNGKPNRNGGPRHGNGA